MSSRESQLDHRIFTIGHGNLDIKSYVDLLHQFEVELVVDVRSTPYSRYVSHFNREVLEGTLREKSFAYRYAGAYLGGRPEDPAYYKDGAVPDDPRADYLRLVDYQAVSQTEWYRAGIRRLLDLAEQRVTAIQCSEEDPLRCHRHYLIAVSLIERGWDVVHIRRNGSATGALDLMNESLASQPNQTVAQLSLL